MDYMEMDDLCIAGRELYLYILHTQAPYRAFYVPAAKNLSRRFKRGEFDLDKAVIAMNYCAINCAKDYHRQCGSMRQPWYKTFPVNVRREVAEVLAREIHAEFKIGNFWE